MTSDKIIKRLQARCKLAAEAAPNLVLAVALAQAENELHFLKALIADATAE